ncbi:MAG: hypothetical protein JOZ86_01935 [Candidatus Eremiobacteraeota bacterium]|nr:hypothetical protein [Candidatus Eremiobacteraeota bacterium]
MSSRWRFLFAGTIALVCTACGTGVAPRTFGSRYVARWRQVTAGDWHVAVSGYTAADVMATRVPASFDVSRHPEIGGKPPSAERSADNYVNKPCGSGLCPSPLFFRSQQGSGSVYQDSNGVYHLPDGSVWTSTDAIYSGPNNSGVLEGYIYYGSNGSEWYAGSDHAGNPEPMADYQAHVSAWYQANTSPC